MTIVQLQPISVVLTAPEEQVVAINKALAGGDVQVIAQSSDGTKTLSKGRLALVNNEVDQAAGTIRMKARFDNQDNALWPGLSVSTHAAGRNAEGRDGGARRMRSSTGRTGSSSMSSATTTRST